MTRSDITDKIFLITPTLEHSVSQKLRRFGICSWELFFIKHDKKLPPEIKVSFIIHPVYCYFCLFSYFQCHMFLRCWNVFLSNCKFNISCFFLLPSTARSFFYQRLDMCFILIYLLTLFSNSSFNWYAMYTTSSLSFAHINE